MVGNLGFTFECGKCVGSVVMGSGNVMENEDMEYSVFYRKVRKMSLG